MRTKLLNLEKHSTCRCFLMKTFRIGRRQIRKITALTASVMLLFTPLTAQASSLSGSFNSAGIGSLMDMLTSSDTYEDVVSSAEEITWGYSDLGICNVEENNLNIRSAPDIEASMVGKLPKHAACEILEDLGEWYHISSGKVDGYVKSEYLLTGLEARQMASSLVQTLAVVTCDVLKIREEPNTDCPVVTTVPQGEELEYVETLDDGWVAVMLDDEQVYVSGEYVEIQQKLETAITMKELLYGQGVSNLRVDLCQYAKQFLGNPYVWGGTSLTKGADCSGFVLSVFKHFGYTLPHSSRSQAQCGTKISASNAQPGDLFFYGKSGTINHVAIYIGGGQVIHASSPKTGIRISSAYYRSPIKVVRILP